MLFMDEEIREPPLTVSNMTKRIAIVVALAAFLTACERPNSPDFKLQQRVQTPLVLDREYPFLGGSEALIDTNSTEFDSLFSVDGDGLVTLSREEELTFQNLDNVVPGISATSTQIDAAVGEIRLDDFSSQSVNGNLGSASFQQITGLDPAGFPQGQNLPAGSTPSAVNIDLDTDYFVSATISTGGTITISIQNDLGFDADGSPGMTVTLNAGGTPLDTDSKNVPHGSTVDFTFAIAAGEQLADLNVDVSASWTDQMMQDEPNNVVVSDLQASGLEASEVEAVVSSQDFSSSGQSTIDNAEFEMTAPEHYTELASGQIHIHQVVNTLDVDIDQLVVSFPDILSAPYTAADSLVIRFEGATAIPRNSQNQVEHTEPLGGYRVFAQNNQVDYNVAGLTENTQQGSGSQARTIRNTDNVQVTVDLENLVVAEGFGILKPRDIILNNDVSANGIDQVDVFNDNEAEIVSVDGLDALSEKIGGIEFANPVLSLNYETNMGSSAEVFSTIAGINGRGEQIFLRGTSGSPYEVSDAEAPDQLQVNGVSAGGSRMIGFDIDTTWSGTINRSIVFDRGNSNLDDFFSILPSEIRFITDARVNDNSVEGLIRAPVTLNSTLSIDLPMNISTAGSTYDDTLSADLSDLPGEGDDTRLVEANVSIGYGNGLPLRFAVNLTFLDAQDAAITTVPLQGGDPLEIEAAPVDQSTRYVQQVNEGEFVIGLNEEQISRINQTRNILLNATFNTTDQSNVRIRAEDSITFTIGINVEIETTVN